MFRKTLAALLGAAAMLGPALAEAQTTQPNLVVRDANGALQTTCSYAVSSVLYPCHVMVGQDGSLNLHLFATDTAGDVIVVGKGVAGTGAGGVVTVQGDPAGTPVPISGTITATIAANSSINVAQVNGITTSTGAGATGTGTQRVGVAQDTTTIAGAAPGTAGTASANVVTVQGVTSMTPVQVSQATAANLNATVVGTGTLAVQNTASLVAGTNLIGKVGIDQTTPGTTNGVTLAPTSAAGAGIPPIASTAAESSHVFKASAGNLYGVTVTAGATSGLLMVFNATSAPVDGAVTPTYCIVVPANTSAGLSFSGIPPAAFSTGITAVFSSGTACGTKAASATAWFAGLVQ